MKTVNGKLLGRIINDSDGFSQKLKNFEQDINGVELSFQELSSRVSKAENLVREEVQQKALLRQIELYVQHLKERCNNLETLLEKEQERLSITYQQEVKKLNLLLQHQQKQLAYLETTKLNLLESNITNLKQQMPTKLLWITFSSSLIVGIISLGGWLNINSLDDQLQKNQSWFDSRQLLVDYPANKKPI